MNLTKALQNLWRLTSKQMSFIITGSYIGSLIVPLIIFSICFYVILYNSLNLDLKRKLNDNEYIKQQAKARLVPEYQELHSLENQYIEFKKAALFLDDVILERKADFEIIQEKLGSIKRNLEILQMKNQELERKNLLKHNCKDTEEVKSYSFFN